MSILSRCYDEMKASPQLSVLVLSEMTTRTNIGLRGYGQVVDSCQHSHTIMSNGLRASSVAADDDDAITSNDGLRFFALGDAWV